MIENGNLTVNVQIFRVIGGSWTGLEGRHIPFDDMHAISIAPMEMYMGNMYWVENDHTYDQDISEIKEMGFNLIRLADLRTLAGLGAELGVSNIMGIDIFNEPWDYSWEKWRSLIDQVYEAIDAVNPNILIFARGIPASRRKSGRESGSRSDKAANTDITR